MPIKNLKTKTHATGKDAHQKLIQKRLINASSAYISNLNGDKNKIGKSRDLSTRGSLHLKSVQPRVLWMSMLLDDCSISMISKGLFDIYI